MTNKSSSLMLKLVCMDILLLLTPVSLSSPPLKLGDKCSPSPPRRAGISPLPLTGRNETRWMAGGGMEDGPQDFCDPSIPLVCSPSSARCICKGGFTISRNGTSCLEIARAGLQSPCTESIQCWKGLLGRLSECSPVTQTCACYHSDSIPIVFHEGRCFYGESLGDFCQVEGLCERTTKNAECRGGRCACMEGYVGSWDKSRCLQIASVGLDSPCEENVQCEASPLGPLSQCNQVKMRCECYSIPMVPTIFHASKCYFGAALGDVCQVDPQCQAVSPGASCAKDGKCRCGEGHVVSGNGSACLQQIPSADGSSTAPSSDHLCIEDSECQRGLGREWRCVDRKCECVIGVNETDGGGKCQEAWDNKGLGQPCKLSRQCWGRAEAAVCYNGRCECNEETHVRSSDGRKCLGIGSEGLGSECDESEQCRKGPLGPLAACSPAGRCACSDILPVLLHGGRCYFHRGLGAPCLLDVECEAGGGPQSLCRNGRCECSGGPFCSSSAPSTLHFTSVLMTLQKLILLLYSSRLISFHSSFCNHFVIIL